VGCGNLQLGGDVKIEQKMLSSICFEVESDAGAQTMSPIS
jgi:hypothetical protein